MPGARRASKARTWAGRLARLAATLVVITILFVAYAYQEFERNLLVSKHVSEGANLAAACRDGSLNAGQTHAALGLEPPEAYGGSFTHAVYVEVESDSRATVTSVYVVENRAVPGSVCRR